MAFTEAFAADIESAAASSSQVGVVAKPINPKQTLHVDGDYLAYYHGVVEDAGIARRSLLDRLAAAKEAAGAGKVYVHLTTPTSNKGFRSLIATVKPYQGNRKSGKKPVNWHVMRSVMEFHDGGLFTPILWNDREADDGIAYHAEHCRELHGTEYAYLLYKDKDMQHFGGMHMDWDTYMATEVPHRSWEVVSKLNGKIYGTKWFYLQMLMGDTADHIPGLPKAHGASVGPKTALKLLAGMDEEEAFIQVISLYVDHYGMEEGYDRFAEQASLLWMRRDERGGIANFLNYMPEVPYHIDLLDRAARRMAQRVKESYAEVKRIQNACLSQAGVGSSG